jgi:Flp pilus assembly protein TadG
VAGCALLVEAAASCPWLTRKSRATDGHSTFRRVHLLLMKSSLIDLFNDTRRPTPCVPVCGAHGRTVLSRTIRARFVKLISTACRCNCLLQPALWRSRPAAPAVLREERGAVAVIAALALTSLIGLVGLAVDVGMWYRAIRALQNAADAAAIAASQNGTASYQSEAKAVAAQYGFVDGTGGITVTALNNQTCPNGNSDCYEVTVAQASAPLFFSGVLGISAPALSGAAMASSSGTHNYCMLALAGSGTTPAIQGNGAASANMNGCSIMSNTGATCNGHNLGATYGDAHGTNNGCGITEHSNVPTVSDPYASLANQVLTNPCGTSASNFPQEPAHTHDPPLPASNQWGASGITTAITLSDPPTIANKGIVCGDLQLQGDVTLTTASPGSLLMIENGRLDLNGHTLQTAPGSALTIVFSGPTVAGQSYTHSPTGSGTLNFMAPTSGAWKGIALYQDPALTSGVDISYAGNNPLWDITGVIYLPHSSVSFSGAINKSAYGASCLDFVVDNITISGTAAIEATSPASCAPAGVTLPSNIVGGIALVM